MIISDPVSEFFDIVSEPSNNEIKRIYIFTSPEIDSIASMNILEEILKIKEMKFSLFCVDSYSELEKSFAANKENIGYAVFINCCGSINLRKFLNPSRQQKLFVCD